MKNIVVMLAFCLAFLSCGEDSSISCCKYCNPDESIPCGDTCICKEYKCHKGENTGCACWR